MTNIFYQLINMVAPSAISFFKNGKPEENHHYNITI